jgi:hypothetical protein
MGRRILVICLIFTTLCTGCAGDQPSLADRVDRFNNRIAAETNGSQRVRPTTIELVFLSCMTAQPTLR